MKIFISVKLKSNTQPRRQKLNFFDFRNIKQNLDAFRIPTDAHT